jgi:hypothetical protein
MSGLMLTRASRHVRKWPNSEEPSRQSTYPYPRAVEGRIRIAEFVRVEDLALTAMCASAQD